MNAPTKFAEFLGYDEDNNMRMRLGHTIYVRKGFKIFSENKDGSLTRISLETLVAKAWIQQNFDREHNFQRRKKLALDLQHSHIPLHERQAYKRRMGWVGAR